ncbi:MAG: hypothetical protein JW809_19375 [Pirellulales bacterium]|nr:hypothetical protein [Pirellulales bacterium]
MKPYNGFSPQQRARTCPWLRREYESGRRARPTVCEACGQTEGAIEAHAEDYSEPFGDHICEFSLCYRCHMILHCRFGCPDAFHHYVQTLASGRRFVAMPGRSWPTFAREHLQGRTAPTEPADAPPRGFDHILQRGREVLARRQAESPCAASSEPDDRVPEGYLF